MSNNGQAYKEMKLQPLDVIIQNFNPSAVRGYFVGETIAYLMRYNGSGVNADRTGVKDLEKAKSFIDKLIEYDREHAPGPVRKEKPLAPASKIQPKDGIWP